MKAHFWPILFAAGLCLPIACSEPTPQGNEGSPDDVKNQFSLHEFTISENTEAGKRLKELHEGKQVDMDGDGFAESQSIIDENGVIYLESVTPEGNVLFYSEKHPDGREHMLFDTNNDGATDIQEDLTTTPIHRRIRLVDRNFDGYPEERTTTIYDHENALMKVSEEFDEEGKGNYVVLKKWSRKMITVRRAQDEKSRPPANPPQENPKTRRAPSPTLKPFNLTSQR